MNRKIIVTALALAMTPVILSAYTISINGGEDLVVESMTGTADRMDFIANTGGGGGGSDAPTITTSSFSKAENAGTNVGTITYSDPNGDAVSLDLSGADAAKFNLVGDVLSFKTAPDYEVPGSASGTNTYSILVTATDESVTKESSSKTIPIFVKNDSSDDPVTGNCPEIPKDVSINVSHPLAASNGWAVSVPNTTLGISATKTVSIKVHTTSSSSQTGSVGWAQDGNTDDIERTLWISECPGGEALLPANFDPSSIGARFYGNPCTDTWVSNSNFKYAQQPQSGLDIYQSCAILINKDYYINIKNNNCKKSSCDVRLGTNVKK